MKNKLFGILLLFFILMTAFGYECYWLKEFDSIHNSSFFRPQKFYYGSQKEIVYLGDKSYVFFRPVDHTWWSAGLKGDTIGTLRFDTNEGNGHLVYNNKENKRLYNVVDPDINEKDKDISGTRLAACLYRNKIYVFYDRIGTKKGEYKDWTKREINYKCVENPEQRWSDPTIIKMKNPIETGFGRYASQLLMSASVIDDKLFLFYVCSENPDNHGCLMYDGYEWVELNTKESMLKGWSGAHIDSISAQAVTLSDSKTPAIAFTVKGEKIVYVYLFDGKGHRDANYATKPVEMTALKLFKIKENKYPVKTLFAHIEGGDTSRSLLQIFVSPEYRLECDLEKKLIIRKENKRRLRLGNVSSFYPIITSIKEDNGKGKENLKQYVTLVNHMSMFEKGTKVSSCDKYESDYFEYKDGYEYETGAGSIVNGVMLPSTPSAWTLIGVIEGVPPFVTNDGNVDSRTSWVKYSQTKNKSVSNTTTYGVNASTGINISPNTSPVSGYKGANGDALNLSMTQGFRKMYEWSSSFTKDFTIDFTALQHNTNKYGECGMLIVSQPTLKFARYNQKLDGKNIGEMKITSVIGNNISVEYYPLTKPWEGMTPRPRSSTPWAWMKEEILYPAEKATLMLKPDQIPNNIMADVFGATVGTSVSLVKKEALSTQENSHSSISFSFLLFNTSHDKSLDLDYSTSTSISEDLRAGIKLSHPDPDYETNFRKIEITPLWYTAVKNGPKPPWVPNIYAGGNPWCLTWHVRKLDMNPNLSAKLLAAGIIKSFLIKKDEKIKKD